MDGGKAGGLNIEHHIGLPHQGLSLLIDDNVPQVIHQVCLHTINDLEEILSVRIGVSRLFPFSFLCFPQILPHMIGIGERLCHAMIRDGNGRHAPFVCPFYNILRLGNTVHIAHLRMAVEFHPLADAVILAAGAEIGNFLDAHQRTDGQLVVKFIHHGHTLEFHKGAGFDAAGNLCHLVISGKQLDGHGVRKVCHVKDENGLFISDFPFIQIHNHAADSDFSHLSQNFIHAHGLALKVSAIEHIGVVGTLNRTDKVSLLLSSSCRSTFGGRRCPFGSGCGLGFGTCRRLCLLTVFHGGSLHAGSNLGNLHGNPAFFLLLASGFFGNTVFLLEHYIQSAPLPDDFFQNPGQLRHFSSGKHRVLHTHVDGLFIGISKLRLPQYIM